MTTAFDITWWAHHEHTRGHSLGTPAPPKLAEAVKLFEQERRARRGLEARAMDEKRKNEQAKAAGPGLVATGGYGYAARNSR